jgi:hypothetical protein
VNGLGLTYKTTMGISMATIPDVCKTPSPGGPIPIPYPNIAKHSSLTGGTTTVKAKGNMIANKGSQYGSSNGDEAGTAGGVKSGVNMKATDWITYSFDVKVDGKNACRHTDKKFHNNQNAADLGGQVDPADGKPWHKCGEIASYGSLCNSGQAEGVFERDHIPAKAQLMARAARMKAFKSATTAQQDCVNAAVEYRGLAIVIPIAAHRDHSPTCGSRNDEALINKDSKTKASMDKAAKRDTRAMQTHLNAEAKNGTQEQKDCAAAYKKAAKKIKKNNPDKMIKKAIADCKAKYP